MSAFRVPLAARPSRHLPNPGSSKAFSRCCGGREQDDVIYQVSPPRDNAPQSLAHVIHPDQLVRRTPVDGLDGEPLRTYVGALEEPSLPRARFQWRNPHEAAIAADQVLSVEVSYAPGWHATANGRPARLANDRLRAPARRAALYRPLPDHLELRRRSRSALDPHCAVDGCSFASPGRWAAGLRRNHTTILRADSL